MEDCGCAVVAVNRVIMMDYFLYLDSTSDSNKSDRMVTDRQNVPKEKPLLHQSFSENKGRPASMLIDSPPTLSRGLHRQVSIF